MNTEQHIKDEAAQYAKEIWNSQESAEDFIQTRKGKRSYEDYIAGRTKTIEEKDRAMKQACNVADAMIEKLDCTKDDTIVKDVIEHFKVIKQLLTNKQ